jgi:hypothetical protein
MKNVKFGFNQIANRTPEFARWIFRAVLYMAAIVNFVLMTVVEIPEDVSYVVGRYSIYAVSFVHFLSKMFGIEAEGPDGAKYQHRS